MPFRIGEKIDWMLKLRTVSHARLGAFSKLAKARWYVSHTLLHTKSSKRAAGPKYKLLGYNVSVANPHTYSYLVDEIYVNGEYDIELEGNSPRIIDCGANIGLATLYFKLRFPGARVTAVEPSSGLFALLAENVRSNELSNVECVQAAVGSESAEVQFFVEPADTGGLRGSTSIDRSSTGAERVRQIAISDLIDGQVDLLKLDVEGAEWDVLESLVESGKIGFIKAMVIEYHHHIVSDQDRLACFLGMLERAGFGYQLRSARWGKMKSFQDIVLFAYQKRPSGD